MARENDVVGVRSSPQPTVLQRIPAGMQQTFIDLVTEKYLMINRPRQQGEICTKMQRLEFTAKK
jgi:hypothetical protein